MTEFFTEYGLFLAKAITLLITLLLAVIGIVAITGRERENSKERLEIEKLNKKYEQMEHALKEQILSKELFKKALKKENKERKNAEKKLKTSPSPTTKKRVFVLDFDGDIKASALSSLREEITALLTVATPDDEVFVRLESGGGLVHAYGLAASQLLRIKKREIPLTIAVDKIAASGGYMMACVADRIIAAPFAIIGSIGVIAQLPNFHRLLKKNDIDYEQITAGEYKRTLTLFGENSDKAREKFREEIEDTHLLFKEFIATHRPQVDITKISTGEHWPASRAQKMELVDELQTSDDYLLQQREKSELLKLNYCQKQSLSQRIGGLIQSTRDNLFSTRWQHQEPPII